MPLTDACHLGWVAGLVEGEGCFSAKGNRPSVQVVTTDSDVAHRLLDWTGVGNVTGPVQRPNRKPYFRWTVSKRDDAGELIEQILPLLCARRAAKAAEVLALWRSAPPKRGTAPTCGYGHALEGKNLCLADGRRKCRICQARRQRDYRARKREAVEAAGVPLLAGSGR